MSSIFAKLIFLALPNQLQLYFIQIVVFIQQVAWKLENQQKWIRTERSKRKKASSIIDKKRLG